MNKPPEKYTIIRCSDCEREVSLVSHVELSEEQVAELMIRAKCQNCLKKSLEAKK